MTKAGGQPPRYWTDDRKQILLSMIEKGCTMSQIAIAIGTTRSSVSGCIMRLKLANEPRLNCAGYAAMQSRSFGSSGPHRRAQYKAQMDELAEHMAEGRSIAHAASLMNVSHDWAHKLRQGICRRLGAQAR